MNELLDSFTDMMRDFEPTKVLIYTDSKDVMESLSEKIGQIPLIIATNNPPMSSILSKSNVHIRRTHYAAPKGLNIFDQAKDVVLTCYAEGLLSGIDRVLFVIYSDVYSIHWFDMEDIDAASLKEVLRGRIDIRVLDAVFKIGMMIIKEGKEGLPVGGLMIMGDVNKVINHTRELIRNPLEGCSLENLNIREGKNWNTVKEYTMLDGAMVLDEDGNPIAAGRYVMFNKDLDITVEEGLGGRHLAAASITSKTMAIAMVISSEGIIRIYKDGEEIFRVDTI